MAACLAVVIKLPGFRDRKFSVLYPGLLLIVAGLLRPVAKVSGIVFCRLVLFPGVRLGLGAILWFIDYDGGFTSW